MNTVVDTPIRDLCKENKAAMGLTLQQISDRSGLPISTVNNYFSEGSKAPSVHTAGRICAALGVSLDQYFGIDPFVDQRAADRLEHYEKLVDALHAENDRLLELEKYLRLKTDERSQRIDQLSNRLGRVRSGFWIAATLAVASLAALVFSLVF